MLKKIFFLVLVGTGSVLCGQTLQKTALKIGELDVGTMSVYGFGSDENNYYVYHGRANSFFIINKKFTTYKECYIKEEKGDRFLKILMAEDDVVVLAARNKKSEQKTQIVKQSYSKTTGKIKGETVIASFQKSKSENWYILTGTSPDKTKIGFLFMVANKKNTVDGYYIAVLDQDCRFEWDATHDLEISNEMFSVQDLIVTNGGEVYIAMSSFPEKAKKAADKKTYIDLVFLTDGTKDKMKMPLEKYSEADVKLKVLKNGDVYMAALFAENDDSYVKEFFSMKINAQNFNDAGSQRKEIVETNTHIRLPASYFLPGKFLYDLRIEKMLELDNGTIAVVCEQNAAMRLVTQQMVVYIKARGSVTTFFVNGNDASIEDVSVMEKTQLSRSPYNADAKWLNLSIYPFVYGNKVGYIFNDCLLRYTAPAKYKGTGFKSATGKDACIVLNTQENGDKAQIDLLSGNKEAGRLFRQILFEEDDRLILLTQDKKTAYVEILSLP